MGAMDALRHHLEWSLSPRLVLTDPRSGCVPDWLADLLVTAGDDGLAGLTAVYRQAERRAQHRESRVLRIRALLAEASVEFERTGVTPAETLYYVVMQHRLARSATAAHYWCAVLLSRADIAPLYQARLWRELAALHEVDGSYETGLACIKESLAICARHPADGTLLAAASQSHLQRSTLLRLSGRYAEARLAIASAQDAAGPSPAPFVRGLLALRTAGLDLVIGHLDEAERRYAEAAELFDGVSANNRRYAVLRQVTCLRGQGDWDAAVDLATRLLDDVAGDPYRTGQVLLELAEVEIERRNETGLTRVLDQAAPLLSEGDGVESLRWRTLLARSAVVFHKSDAATAQRARTALGEVLQIASRQGRGDVTRLLMALHTLGELSAVHELPFTSLHATRAAVLAAEIQRIAMTNTEDRWQMKRTREAVYSLAALLHTQHGRHADTAAVLELGKADLIELALGDPALSLLTENLEPSPPLEPQKELAETVALLTDSLSDITLSARTMPPLPGTAFPPAGFDQSLTIGLIHDERGWTAIRALGSPIATWSSSTVTAPANVSTLLTRLVRSPAPDLRGVSNDTWRQLGRFLIPNEVADSRSGSLLVSPDPRLWRIPWPALPLGERYLVDRGPLTLTPSLLSHSALHQRTPVPPLGSGSVNAHLDDTLCGSELERDALQRWSESARPRPGLLYITGHASSPESAVGAERLDFDTLSRAQLPEIVILNGCWTGAARPVYGRDPFSLAVGALIGGAKHAIAGSGHIGSEASAHVGSGLLRHLANGLEVASALRQAQITVRDDRPEAGPLDWGGLVAVG